jgi:hypothetical protein
MRGYDSVLTDFDLSLFPEPSSGSAKKQNIIFCGLIFFLTYPTL